MRAREKLALNLGLLRGKRELSVATLAARSLIHESYCRRILAGRTSAGIDVIERLAATLSVDILDLLGDPPTPHQITQLKRGPKPGQKQRNPRRKA